MNQRLDMIHIVSNRLFLALVCLLAFMIIGGFLTANKEAITQGATSWMALLVGVIGGFVSLQRRLKELSEDDLTLLANSWVFILLSPLVGGVLALLLYILFISGLLQGDMFPTFISETKETLTSAVETTATNTSALVATKEYEGSDLIRLFEVQGQSYQDYAKLAFWCFIAGFSEKFVTNIISQFENHAVDAAATANEIIDSDKAEKPDTDSDTDTTTDDSARASQKPND